MTPRCISSETDNLASYLVAQRQRQRNAPFESNFPPTAEIMMALEDMQVAVAYACRQHTQSHLAAGRLGAK